MTLGGVGLAVLICVGLVAVGGTMSSLGLLPTATPRPTNTPRPAPSATVPAPTATLRPATPTAIAAIATKPAPSPVPTAVPATPPTLTPGPAKPATDELPSMGLGRTRAEWERSFGKPERNDGAGDIYANGAFHIMWRDDRVYRLERTWGDRDAKSRDFVIGALRSMVPADATRIGVVQSRGGTPGELYRSPALAKVFARDSFIGGEPGDFIILYRTRADGTITSAVVAIGNNP